MLFLPWAECEPVSAANCIGNTPPEGIASLAGATFCIHGGLPAGVKRLLQRSIHSDVLLSEAAIV